MQKIRYEPTQLQHIANELRAAGEIADFFGIVGDGKRKAASYCP